MKITIDTPRREVLVGGKSVRLTKREWEILLALSSVDGKVLDRKQLGAAINYGKLDDPRLVDVHVARLRRKIGPDAVITARSFGYQINRTLING